MSADGDHVNKKRQDEIIKFFSKTTGLDFSNSQRWLVSSDWKIDVALKSFEEKHYGKQHSPFTSDDKSSCPTQPSVKKDGVAVTENEKKECVDFFCQATGVNRESAEQFLESQGWKFEEALAKFDPAKLLSGCCSTKKSSEKSPPKPTFTGTGYQLGSSKDAKVCEQTPPPQPAASVTKTSPQSLQVPGYDSSYPHTTLQICLPDTSRLIVKCNWTHTIVDIKKLITTAHPELGYARYSLMMNYPRRDVTDDRRTLKDADLLNAALTVVVC